MSTYQMTQREDEIWDGICGSEPPESFAGDSPEQIDATINAVLGAAFASQNPEDRPDGDRDELFEVLRGIVRRTVGV